MRTRTNTGKSGRMAGKEVRHWKQWADSESRRVIACRECRRNMLEHGVIPDALFFLIATPERFYFWKQNRRDFTDQAPAFTLDAAKEFQDAFEKLDKTPQEVSGEALELLVSVLSKSPTSK